jgi:hypothetical protein
MRRVYWRQGWTRSRLSKAPRRSAACRRALPPHHSTVSTCHGHFSCAPSHCYCCLARPVAIVPAPGPLTGSRKRLFTAPSLGGPQQRIPGGSQDHPHAQIPPQLWGESSLWVLACWGCRHRETSREGSEARCSRRKQQQVTTAHWPAGPQKMGTCVSALAPVLPASPRNLLILGGDVITWADVIEW